MYSIDLERALFVAHEAHSGQTRKGEHDVPYVLHPIHAALMAARAGADDEILQAVVLHDVVEDCEGWTLERVEGEFGSRVAGFVAEVTEDKSLSWEQRKQAAIDHVPSLSEGALMVKAVDKLHNLSSLLTDLRAAAQPEDVWQHFNRGSEQTLRMFRTLVDALTERLDGELAAALRDAMDALEAESAG